MSNKSFILSVTGIIIAAAGYVLWIMDDPSAGAELSSVDTSASNALVDDSDIAGPGTASSKDTKDSITNSTSSGNQPKSKKRFSHLTDNSIRWQVKVDQLRRLKSSKLSPADIDELYDLLQHEISPESDSNRAEDWFVTVNEIMEQMSKQGIGKERLTNTLVSILENPSRHPVIRDYAVQHLSNWLSSTEAEHEKNPVQVNLAILSLQKAVTDPENKLTSIPGTVLMSIVDMHQRSAHKEKIDTLFTDLHSQLSDIIDGKSDASLITRTSAISAVGIMQRSEFLPTIRALVDTGSLGASQTTGSLKLSSIGALGYLAEEQDLETLQTIANGNTKFKHAAQAALKTINKRL